MTNEQLNLFDETSASPTPVTPDTEAIAASGERRNSTYDPNTRFSRVEEDLGGGLHAAHLGELTVEQEVKVRHVRKTIPRSRLSSLGKLLADREPDTEHDPAYQPLVHLTDEQKSLGLQHVKRIREQLSKQRTPRSW